MFDVRWLWTFTGLGCSLKTEAFLQSPSTLRVAELSPVACSSSIERPAFSSHVLPRTHVAAASWGSIASGTDTTRRAVPRLRCSAQQSVDGGVMLPAADKADEYATFLSNSIRQHLDDEWLVQECHKGIGEEVERLYRSAVQKGDTDLTTLVLDVGSGMEAFDMGDAFVGPWDIANLVSDFLMEKMGAEVSGCSTKVPSISSMDAADASHKDSAAAESGAVAASAPSVAGPSTFHLTTERVQQMQSDLTSDFARYRFMVDFMDGGDKWDEANVVMAVYQGYTPEDCSAANTDAESVGRGVRRGWAAAFPGPSPPDLRSVEGLVDALEVDFPEDPDMLDGLEVIVETVYGGEVKRMDAGDPDKGAPPNPAYLRRATVVKWLYMVGFLQDDIKRAPDDPAQLKELISGKARLKAPQ